MVLTEDFMIPCLNKTFLGMECMGCGGQRAFWALIHGDFIAAFRYYPAIYTLILFAAFLIINHFYAIRHSEKIKIILVVVNIAVILGNFLIKLYTNQL